MSDNKKYIILRSDDSLKLENAININYPDYELVGPVQMCLRASTNGQWYVATLKLVQSFGDYQNWDGTERRKS